MSQEGSEELSPDLLNSHPENRVLTEVVKSYGKS